jgi:uncharacterized protein YwbE
MELVKPTEGATKKVRSKEIITTFLEKGIPSGEVDVQSTSRPINNVYTSLLTYVQRHPDLGVEVRLVDGRIMLYRDLK